MPTYTFTDGAMAATDHAAALRINFPKLFLDVICRDVKPHWKGDMLAWRTVYTSWNTADYPFFTADTAAGQLYHIRHDLRKQNPEKLLSLFPP